MDRHIYAYVWYVYVHGVLFVICLLSWGDMEGEGRRREKKMEMRDGDEKIKNIKAKIMTVFNNKMKQQGNTEKCKIIKRKKAIGGDKARPQKVSMKGSFGVMQWKRRKNENFACRCALLMCSKTYQERCGMFRVKC